MLNHPSKNPFLGSSRRKEAQDSPEIALEVAPPRIASHFLSGFLTLVLTLTLTTHAAVWPTQDWSEATPESQGLSATKLDSAIAYAQQYGGGSGCLIRHGYLVKEWGDRA